MSFRARWKGMSAYDIHKAIINDYILDRKGSTKLLRRDRSGDKRDIDVIRANHKFLWDDDAVVDTWDKKLAKKYYDRLFKEYCIGDLTLYKDSKIGLRWRTENELVSGKGQFLCGEKHCSKTEELKTWEVNFSYFEEGAKKNALVKIRLCPKCSRKLNYRFKRKEVKRLQTATDIGNQVAATSRSNTQDDSTNTSSTEDVVWGKESSPIPSHEKSQDEELNDFLQDLFL